MKNDDSFLNAFCQTCNMEVAIERITEELDKNPSVVEKFLSCGHKIVQVECVEVVSVSEEVIAEHFDKGKTLLSKFRSTKSRKTKRPAQKVIIIDRVRRIRIHKVEEQDDSGEWQIVHYHEEPI